MLLRKKILILYSIFALSGQQICASVDVEDGRLGVFAPITWVTGKLDKLFSTWINVIRSHSNHYADASQWCHDLAKEAATVLGITRPVKVRCVSAGVLPPGILAIAEFDTIYINEEASAAHSFGVKRFIFFHEFVHIKYNDIKVILLHPALLTSMGISYYCLQKKLGVDLVDGWRLFLGSFLAIFATIYKVKKHVECRADIEAAHACVCWQCVQEMAAARHCPEDQKILEFQLSLMGYLKEDELLKIANELKEKNLLCAYHTPQHHN